MDFKSYKEIINTKKDLFSTSSLLFNNCYIVPEGIFVLYVTLYNVFNKKQYTLAYHVAFTSNILKQLRKEQIILFPKEILKNRLREKNKFSQKFKIQLPKT